MTSPQLPKLDYATPSPDHSFSGTATFPIGWLASAIGLCLTLLFSAGAIVAYGRSTTEKGTGNRAFFRRDAIQFVGCALVAGAPSLWFIATGHRQAKRTLPTSS